MGIYQKLCYKVEDAFVGVMAKKQDSEVVREKVESYRISKEDAKKTTKLEKVPEEEQVEEVK
ncbi:hypothetical protein CR203_14375 [Salipaludibacillus neizhouensis]|uniref:Uncharacterized protein n=1 Tax=Salipaludibacillus neizhouensis TaxID=885475 RepID=A0A3A9KA85_9BACI|nr:hypothetical protein [Salipaludibacillus neizhouensis]RKL66483.1 hypothetical protein CR203_14375 [Salipaludibacillus neizhouensis]